jgi:hypothetical protein
MTTNNAKLVAVTKTLHHLLPDLFVPFDRAYTAWFFRWSGPHIQYHQERVFRETYSAFRSVGQAADLDALDPVTLALGTPMNDEGESVPAAHRP